MEWRGARISVVIDGSELVLDLMGHTLSVGAADGAAPTAPERGSAALEVSVQEGGGEPADTRAGRKGRGPRARFVLRNGRLLVHGEWRPSNLSIVGVGDVLLEDLAVEGAPAGIYVDVACCGRAILTRVSVSCCAGPLRPETVAIRCANRLFEPREAFPPHLGSHRPSSRPAKGPTRDVCGLSLFGCVVRATQAPSVARGPLLVGVVALGLRCLRICGLHVGLRDAPSVSAAACLAAQCQNVAVDQVALDGVDKGDGRRTLLLDDATSRRGVFCDWEGAPTEWLGAFAGSA